MNTRIKQLRQENNYTQELLASKLGMAQTTLSRIECGITVPDAYLLISLSNTFQVSIDYILGVSNHRSRIMHSPKGNAPSNVIQKRGVR